MKKSIAVLILMVCVATAPLFYVSACTSDASVSKVVLDDELKFTTVGVDKLPQAIVDVLLKDYSGYSLQDASIATDSEGVKVYKINLNDGEDVVSEYLFKEDGNQYRK